MHRTLIVSVMLFVIVIGVFLLIIAKGGSIQLQTSPEPQTVAGAITLESRLTGSTSSGDVAIEITPINLEGGSWVFQLSANTHSVDLSKYDLVKITRLEFEDKLLKPIAAPKLSGHHASGNLEFDMNQSPKEFTLTIEGVPNTLKRVYTWTR